MRLIRFCIAAIMLLGVAYGGLWLGMRGAKLQETVVERRVGDALAAAGIGWARVAADGLVLRVAGAAPDRFAREMAHEIAVGAAGIAEVVDAMTVVARDGPPPFAVSLLRSGGRLTVAGRLPDPEMRDRLLARIARAAPGLAVEPLVGTGAAEPAQDPAAAFAVAAEAAGLLRDAHVELGPARVTVRGVVRDAGGLRAISARLGQLAGEGVALSLDLEAPPPVIAPFVVEIAKEASGAALSVSACAARSAGEARQLEALLGQPEGACRHGLGGPAGDWPGAVAAVAGALAALPEGRVRLAYREAVLFPPAGMSEVDVARAGGRLAARMPPGYRARARRAAPVGVAPERPAEGGYWLHLTRREEGVVLAGRMPDRAGMTAMAAFATAGLGQARPEMALSLSDAPPPANWRMAAIAAVEALATLDAGEVALAAGRMRIEGRLDDPAAIGRLHRDLERRLPDYAISSRLSVDLPRMVAGVPLTPARCAVVLNAVMERQKVGFDPGSAVIDARSPGALDRAAEVLRRCPEARLEIGGHTDSQGSADLNRRLSLARAEAVRTALAERGIARARLVAAGYGESEPVANNDTPEGRARNRRIAFKPLETAS